MAHTMLLQIRPEKIYGLVLKQTLKQFASLGLLSMSFREFGL